MDLIKVDRAILRQEIVVYGQLHVAADRTFRSSLVSTADFMAAKSAFEAQQDVIDQLLANTVAVAHLMQLVEQYADARAHQAALDEELKYTQPEEELTGMASAAVKLSAERTHECRQALFELLGTPTNPITDNCPAPCADVSQ